MGHRLSFHTGKCRNLHGHSYKMMLEMEGIVDQRGMVLDYFDVNSIISPIIDRLDHSFLVYREDKQLIDALSAAGSAMVIVDFEATAENICHYFLSEISKALPSNIQRIKIRVSETDDTYAEEEMGLGSNTQL